MLGNDDDPQADLEIPARHRPQADRHQDEAHSDQRAGVDAPSRNLPDRHHRQHRREPARRQHQPGFPCRVAHELLQEYRHQQAGAVEHRTHRDNQHQPDAENLYLEDPQIEDRVGDAQFVDGENDQRGRAEQAGPHHPGRGEPVGALAAVEHDLHRAQPHHQAGDAHVVDLAAARPVLAQKDGIVHERRDHQEGDDRRSAR